MEEGFMGEFAKNEINDLFKELQNKNDKNSNAVNDKYKKIKVKQLISLIGEPIIKQQLGAHYQEKYGNRDYQNWIDSELNRLQKLKDKHDSD